jgi:hypothetical protein
MNDAPTRETTDRTRRPPPPAPVPVRKPIFSSNLEVLQGWRIAARMSQNGGQTP